MSDNWDPEPGKEEWYRDCVTADRGYLVRRNGVEMIKLDRPADNIVRPLSGHRWTIDKDVRPLSKHNVAQVAFVADRLLARFLGDHADKRDWHELKQRERIEFMDKGPQDIRLRNLLFEDIMARCEPVTK